MTGRTVSRGLFICALACVVSGCTTVQYVQLREKPPNPILERLTTTAFGGPGPSVRSRQFLTETGYSGSHDFVPMLRHCHGYIGGNHHREALHATAEISYLASQNAKSHDPPLAMDLCLDSAKFSWIAITTPDDQGRLTDPNEEFNRQTTDIYNTSLQELLRLTKESGDYRLGHSICMPVSGRVLNVEIPFPTEWLTPEQLGEFDFVSNYELLNLRNRHTTEGVGVPIMVRRQRPKVPGDLEIYYADGLSLPLTIVAKFEPGSCLEAHDENIRLQLLDPRETDGIVVDNTLLPLETDLSTPLAWYLTDPKKKLLETFAFFRSDKAQHLEGLYMIQPYDPERIPVLMVHGIWSSPNTWMEMFNDLQSDPVIRDKYQFWFYLYPTGEPLTFSTANLRDRLKEMRVRCDPFGQNEKLDQTVVVGHSMGGLMAYLMTVDSEDKLWKAMSNLPVDKIQADPETHEQIRRVFFFEADRSIDRIVTIASPFRGSGYSNVFTRWLGGSLVSLPNVTSALSDLIFRQNNQSAWDRMFAPRTSLDSLNKDSAVLRLVNQTTAPDNVQHHNIVGVKRTWFTRNSTDGVVKVKSARRDDVDTEVVIRASHSGVQRHPETIAEVRRVLMQHLEDVRHRTYPVIPVEHSGSPSTIRSVQSAQLTP
ncbi:MAG: alpha/beta hydrolase [Planctomycetaceae bacterium]